MAIFESFDEEFFKVDDTKTKLTKIKTGGATAFGNELTRRGLYEFKFKIDKGAPSIGISRGNALLKSDHRDTECVHYILNHNGDFFTLDPYENQTTLKFGEGDTVTMRVDTNLCRLQIAINDGDLAPLMNFMDPQITRLKRNPHIQYDDDADQDLVLLPFYVSISMPNEGSSVSIIDVYQPDEWLVQADDDEATKIEKLLDQCASFREMVLELVRIYTGLVHVA